MSRRKRGGVLSVALASALGVAGCGAQCFDCRDPGCGCLGGAVCVAVDQLPASNMPGAMHYTAYQCRDAEKKAP